MDGYPMVNGSDGPRHPADYNLEEHYTYLAAREHLQQFCGQVPPKKKKKVVERTEADSPATKSKVKI